MTRRRSRKLGRDDEPELDLRELTGFGGELYWAVGETSGGAPYGLTLSEYSALIEDADRERGWVVAKRLLRRALATTTAREPVVGRVTEIGRGLSRDVFAAEVSTAGDEMHLVVLLPREPDAGLTERTRREAPLLARLAAIDRPSRVPRPIAVLPTTKGPALIREHLDGVPVDLRAGRMSGIRPWALVGELAAAVHALPTDDLGELAGYATRRDHGAAVLAELSALAHAADAGVRAALGWLHDNLPPDEPTSLVHGDLLGQNILVSIFAEPELPPALIDWEYARRGDPAYDLAIVTRGVRKPFQIADGFDRLLAAYRASSRRELRPRDVRFHELCLALRWYRGEQNPHARPQHLQRIENLLEWGRRG